MSWPIWQTTRQRRETREQFIFPSLNKLPPVLPLSANLCPVCACNGFVFKHLFFGPLFHPLLSLVFLTPGPGSSPRALCMFPVPPCLASLMCMLFPGPWYWQITFQLHSRRHLFFCDHGTRLALSDPFPPLSSGGLGLTLRSTTEW
jgi:hypothetical protein